MRKFHTFELALLLALAAALLWGAWSLHRQDDLQAKMIRLHVIANSDNAADQALKLQVRDAVLTRAEAILRESADMNDARRRLTDALPAIGDAAAAELAAQHRDDPHLRLT
ncbi:Sporulation stage II, protein R, partial [human gut metagenome]